MKHISSRWQGALIVCGKCSKKLDGGFGKRGRQSLVKALRAESGGSRKRKAPLGIVESRCLGLCPRNAVVIIDSRHPDDWLLVPAGASAAAVLEELAASGKPHKAPAGD